MPTANWTRIVIGLAAVMAIAIVWATSGNVDLTYVKALITASGSSFCRSSPMTGGRGGGRRSAG